MANTMFYVNGGVDTNGGNGGTPTTITGCSISSGNQAAGKITHVGTNIFSAINVGDWICWDTTGAKQYGRVTAVSGSPSYITVIRTDGGGTLFTVGSNKSITANGSWLSLSMVNVVTTLSTNANGDPPYVTIGLAGGGGGMSPVFTFATSGTSSIPIIIDCGTTLTIYDIYDTFNTDMALISGSYLNIKCNFLLHSTMANPPTPPAPPGTTYKNRIGLHVTGSHNTINRISSATWQQAGIKDEGTNNTFTFCAVDSITTTPAIKLGAGSVWKDGIIHNTMVKDTMGIQVG